MKLNLSEPYPLNESLKGRLTISFLFGSFVFLFLAIFQPFELSKLPNGILLIAFGYGTVCFGSMVLINLAAFLGLPSYFSESSWTTKKQILWVIINVIFIGLGNYVFSVFINLAAFTWWNLLVFEVYTITLALFPITILILVNQVRLSSKFDRQSEQLNLDIEKNQSKCIAPTTQPIVTFDTGNSKFVLPIEDFLFARSDDNYVEIYFLKNAVVSRKILRNTLKSVYALLSDYNSIFKCHRSYIVNLQHLQKISGNAQGYILHLKGTDERLPVSRTLNKSIKSYLTDYL